jgi:hypothetical protein
MKPHIEQGRNILSGYVAANVEDHESLAEQLQEQNSKLIRSCTMEGQAHDELHKWLHPHMNLIQKLSKAQNAEAAEDVIGELQTSYKTYDLYFE